MADKEVKILFKIEGIEGYITNLDDLKGALSGVEQATEKANQATKELEKAADNFDSLSNKLEIMEGSVRVLAGSFEMLAGTAALLGLEDNEFFKGLEKNVIGVIALSQGAIDATEGFSKMAKALRESSKAQAAMNLVANANPYVLLATAVVALAGALLLFKTRANDAEAAQSRLNKTFNEVAERERGQIEFERELARVRGELNPEKDIELNNKLIETYGQEIIQSKARINAAKIGEVTEEEQELIDRLEENIAKRQEQIKQAQRNNTLINERVKAEQAATDAEEEAERIRIANEKAKEVRHQKELARIAAEQLAKQNAATTEADIFNNQAELEDFLYRESLELREQELYDLQESYYEKLNLAEGNAELIAELNSWYDAQKKAQQALWDKEDEDNLKAKLENEKNIRDLYYDNEKASYQQLQEAKINIANGAFNLLGAMAADNEKLSDAIFVAQKAFEAAQVFIKGKKDITQARSNMINSIAELNLKASTNPALAPLYLGLIPSVVATGTSAINAIRLNTVSGIAGIVASGISQFKGGGAGNLDSGGGVGGTSPIALNYNFDQAAGPTIQPGQTSTGQMQSSPVRTYVLASDVNNALQAQNQINNLSRL